MNSTRRNIAGMALAAMASSFSLSAALVEPFNISKLAVNIDNVDGMKVADFLADDSLDIVLLGRNNQKQKQLQLFTLTEGKSSEQAPDVVPLDSNVLFYDTGTLAGTDKTSLMFLQPGKVVRYDMTTQKLHTLVETQSIYRPSRQKTTEISAMQFLYDLNKDGLSDIVIADFEYTNIFIQQADGSFSAPQKIKVQAEMEVFSRNRAVFSAAQMYVADNNFDGQQDLIYRIGSELHSYHQQDGQFTPTATITQLTPSLPLSDEDDDFSKDQSDLVTHSFYKLVDLNNDTILDLITKVTKSSGIFDKTSKYQFYFGQRGEMANKTAMVNYPAEPDSQISSEGMQFELTLVDFDGDKQLDLVSPSFELGLGSIIASLFSSSADLDVTFHPLKGTEGYHAKANLEKELSVDFDLSSGQQVYPLLKINDFDGDGLNDLLIGHGSKKAYLYTGVKSKKLFARKAKKFKMRLPRNGQLIAANDLNNDGHTDLIIRYDKLDGEALNSEMKILLAK